MFDYAGAISKANSISGCADGLRNQARNMDRLLDIVGSKYSGKDADAYSKAVRKAKSELSEIASELDSLAARIRSAASDVRDEELAEMALLEEQANSVRT